MHTEPHSKQDFTGNTTQEVWALAREISHNSVGQSVPSSSYLTDRDTAALMCLAQIAFQFYLYPYVYSYIHILYPLICGVLLATLGESLRGASATFRYLTTVGSRPPRGRFSHLAMFRLGTLLFIPGYLTITLYRVFASAESGASLILMIR